MCVVVFSTKGVIVVRCVYNICFDRRGVFGVVVSWQFDFRVNKEDVWPNVKSERDIVLWKALNIHNIGDDRPCELFQRGRLGVQPSPSPPPSYPLLMVD